MELKSDILEEEYFTALNIEKEDARKLRYLIENIKDFDKGCVVQLGIEFINGKLTGNGMVYSSLGNKCFNSEISFCDKTKSLFVETKVMPVYGTDYFVYDEFTFERDNIKVISNSDLDKSTVTRTIEYRETNRSL
ncbi:MAG: hypothetical protein RR189_00905 [Bacilli bacterium]